MTSTVYASTRAYLKKGYVAPGGSRFNMEPEASAMVTFVGGDTCLRDPNDHTSYLEFHPGKYPLPGYPDPSNFGYVTVTVEFDDLPELDPFDLLEVHFVGYANGWFGSFGTGVAWLPPRYYSDYQTAFNQPGTVQFMFGLSAFQNNVAYQTPENSALRAPQDVNHRSTPFEQFFDDERFSNPLDEVELACFRGGSYSAGFRMYGAYARVTKGVNPSNDRLPFAPKFAFSLYNNGFVVVSGDGAQSVVNGNNNGVSQETPHVLWSDGSVAQLSPGGLFSVQRPTQDYAYAMPTLTDDQRAVVVDMFNGLCSLVPNAERGTAIVAGLREYYDAGWHTKGIFYEYTKECRLLRTIEVDGDAGAYFDAGTPLPLHGEVVNDELTFMGGADGARQNNPTSLDYAAIYRLNLGTGAFSVVVTETETNSHSTDDPAYPGWTSSLCLVPFGERDIITASGGGGNGAGYPDGVLDMFFQRWSYDGQWLGTLGFYYEAPDYAWGGPYGNVGGMVCDENGLLTFCYVGDMTTASPSGDEYDGLVQLDSNVIPSDGTVKIVSPTANLKTFWQVASGIQEGISFYLTKEISPYNSAETGDVRVRFQ